MEGHTQGHLKRNREDVLFRIPKTSYFRTRYREISMIVVHSSEIETKKSLILKEKRLDLLGSDIMKDIYKIRTKGCALTENIVSGDKYRITVLTDGLIRLEYSEKGDFEDRATQCALYRDFPKVKYRIIETDDGIEIHTARIHLMYNKKEFSPYGLLGKALIHRLDEEWADAEKVYTAILNEYPEMTDVYLKRAECYLHLDQLSKLSEDLQKVATEEFANPTYYFLRGQLRLKQFDKDAAQSDFKKAKELGMESEMLQPWIN